MKIFSLALKLSVIFSVVLLRSKINCDVAKELENAHLESNANDPMVKMSEEIELLKHEVENLKSGESRAATVVIGLPRSCNEIKEFNPNLTYGEYIIDPDGIHVGFDPVTVLCDETGTTYISHQLEANDLSTGNCSKPGCYTQGMVYNVHYRQIEALIEISDACRQYFKYECLVSPFEYNGTQYNYWIDRFGRENYYWAGSNTTRHTCQCGLNGACGNNPNLRCNCDSLGFEIFNDIGYITEKDALPIQQLKFGKISLAPNQEYGAFTLGKLECSGRAKVNGMPTSCRDLYRIGHVLNDFYSIKVNNKIETVFCDFSLSPFDLKFETRLGFEDLKSNQVFFDVARVSDFGLTGSSISWEFAKLNIGNALNLANGFFTAPVSGRYYFAFVGKNSLANSVVTTVYLTVQGVVQAEVYDTASSTSSNAPIQATVDLKKGQLVYAYLASGKIDAKSRFTGWLIEEDLDN